MFLAEGAGLSYKGGDHVRCFAAMQTC